MCIRQADTWQLLYDEAPTSPAHLLVCFASVPSEAFGIFIHIPWTTLFLRKSGGPCMTSTLLLNTTTIRRGSGIPSIFGEYACLGR